MLSKRQKLKKLFKITFMVLLKTSLTLNFLVPTEECKIFLESLSVLYNFPRRFYFIISFFILLSSGRKHFPINIDFHYYYFFLLSIRFSD